MTPSDSNIQPNLKTTGPSGTRSTAWIQKMLLDSWSVADSIIWLHIDSVQHIIGAQSSFVHWLSSKYLINELIK